MITPTDNQHSPVSIPDGSPISKKKKSQLKRISKFVTSSFNRSQHSSKKERKKFKGKKTSQSFSVAHSSSSKEQRIASFQTIFSWNNCRASFRLVPKALHLSKGELPTFDNAWHKTTQTLLDFFQSASEDPLTYDLPIIYYAHSQTLLHRFFKKNPIYLTEELQSYYPGLMLQALFTAFKYLEDDTIWNSDFAELLLRHVKQKKISKDMITKDLNAMEQFFLAGIGFECTMSLPPDVEIRTFLCAIPIMDKDLPTFFASLPVGSYTVQKKEDAYQVDIKKSNVSIDRYHFTFSDTGEPVEVCETSKAASSSSAQQPAPAQSISQLIESWGGHRLVR